MKFRKCLTLSLILHGSCVPKQEGVPRHVSPGISRDLFVVHTVKADPATDRKEARLKIDSTYRNHQFFCYGEVRQQFRLTPAGLESANSEALGELIFEQGVQLLIAEQKGGQALAVIVRLPEVGFLTVAVDEPMQELQLQDCQAEATVFFLPERATVYRDRDLTHRMCELNANTVLGSGPPDGEVDLAHFRDLVEQRIVEAEEGLLQLPMKDSSHLDCGNLRRLYVRGGMPVTPLLKNGWKWDAKQHQWAETRGN